jgi:hypothetical protein
LLDSIISDSGLGGNPLKLIAEPGPIVTIARNVTFHRPRPAFWLSMPRTEDAESVN